MEKIELEEAEIILSDEDYNECLNRVEEKNINGKKDNLILNMICGGNILLSIMAGIFSLKGIYEGNNVKILILVLSAILIAAIIVILKKFEEKKVMVPSNIELTHMIKDEQYTVIDIYQLNDNITIVLEGENNERCKYFLSTVDIINTRKIGSKKTILDLKESRITFPNKEMDDLLLA